MRYENGIMKDIKISYIGGGSRGWAWTLMNDLGRDSNVSRGNACKNTLIMKKEESRFITAFFNHEAYSTYDN